jgi:ketosteroid isomerase-like protein
MSVSGARLLAVAALAAIGAAPLALATESSERAAVEAAAQAWAKAFNARDANALIALATEDLVVLDANGPPMSGGRAREAWKKALGAGRGQVTSVSKEVVIAGDVAWRIAALGQGQALEIWKRVGGEWKIHRQMSSNLLTQSNLLPTPTEPVLDRPAN